MTRPTQSFLIADFLAQRRLALVGVSHDEKDFSRGLFRELVARHYDVVPVHPALDSVEGVRCYTRLQSVPPPPLDGALLMTHPAVTEQVVRDCAEAGVPRVWLHRGVGSGAVSPAAIAFCHENGIRVVEGACPFMFLPRTAAVHRVHGWLARLLHRHPAQHRAA